MTDIPKPIKTVKNPAESEFKEKGSVFLGLIYPVKDSLEAENILKTVKKKYFDASHHCYALRIKDLFKYSDAGEPSGTAGIRILNAIDHFELRDVLCVVVRWFGGTKLGVGPLGRAYYQGAEEAIKSAKIIEKRPFYLYQVNVPFDITNTAYHIFEKHGAKIKSTEYLEIVQFLCFFPAEISEKIGQELLNASNNKISIEQMALDYIPI